MPVVFSFFTEFLSRERRGPMIGFLASFWMVGNIMTAGIAWLIIPRLNLAGRIGGINYHSWRIFVALCSIPSLSSALFIFLLPESPKYLQKVCIFRSIIYITYIYITYHILLILIILSISILNYSCIFVYRICIARSAFHSLEHC